MSQPLAFQCLNSCKVSLSLRIKSQILTQAPKPCMVWPPHTFPASTLVSSRCLWCNMLPHHKTFAHTAPFPCIHVPHPLCLVNSSSFSSRLKCLLPSEDSRVYYAFIKLFAFFQAHISVHK